MQLSIPVVESIALFTLYVTYIFLDSPKPSFIPANPVVVETLYSSPFESVIVPLLFHEIAFLLPSGLYEYDALAIVVTAFISFPLLLAIYLETSAVT